MVRISWWNSVRATTNLLWPNDYNSLGLLNVEAKVGHRIVPLLQSLYNDVLLYPVRLRSWCWNHTVAVANTWEKMGGGSRVCWLGSGKWLIAEEDRFDCVKDIRRALVVDNRDGNWHGFMGRLGWVPIYTVQLLLPPPPRAPPDKDLPLLNIKRASLLFTIRYLFDAGWLNSSLPTSLSSSLSSSLLRFQDIGRVLWGYI